MESPLSRRRVVVYFTSMNILYSTLFACILSMNKCFLNFFSIDKNYDSTSIEFNVRTLSVDHKVECLKARDLNLTLLHIPEH